jgi:malonyl-CoA O-methyltransferase
VALLNGQIGLRGWSRWSGTLGGWGRRVAAVPAQVLPTREAYAVWADTYPPKPHNPLMDAEQAIMAPLLTAVAPRHALDVGTGTGRNLPLLAEAGAQRAVGVDLSMPMLVRGGARARVCGDALHLPFRDQAFDLVCSSLMVGDIEQINAWTAEAARLLTRRGHLVYSDFHPAWAARGWRRTFRTARGDQFEVGYFPHTLAQHLNAIARAGLKVRTIREPRLEGRAAPVIVLFHAVKP